MTEQQALHRLTSLCSRAEYSSYDLRQKMARWDIPTELQEKLLARLVREKYVDDVRYAHSFVRDKLYFNHWGSQKIRTALLQKHLPKPIIDEALTEVDPSEYTTILSELLRQKAKSLSALTPYERRMRLLRFASSRGFTLDIIRQCLPEIDEE